MNSGLIKRAVDTFDGLISSKAMPFEAFSYGAVRRLKVAADAEDIEFKYDPNVLKGVH